MDKNKYRIRAKKDLLNNGQCFTKDKIYEVETWRTITTTASLMDVAVINDQGQKHTLSSWWRDFELEKTWIARNGDQEEKIKAFNHTEAREWVNEHLDEPHKWELEEQNY